MPMNRKRYPSNWNDIALDLKNKCNWTCQNCGKICKKPDETWEEFKFRTGTDISIKKMRYILTVAHLDHTPENVDPDNLKCLCSVCHLKYDVRDMGKKKMLKREYYGQLKLFE